MGHALGAALMAVGGLIVLVCGTYTVWVFVVVVGGAVAGGGHSISELVTASASVLAIGGVPSAIGVAITIMGWRIARRAD